MIAAYSVELFFMKTVDWIMSVIALCLLIGVTYLFVIPTVALELQKTRLSELHLNCSVAQRKRGGIVQLSVPPEHLHRMIQSSKAEQALVNLTVGYTLKNLLKPLFIYRRGNTFLMSSFQNHKNSFFEPFFQP